jgi:hypothetical protein
LTIVDLPAPFSPTSAWISPPCSGNETSRTAATAPNDLETPRTSRSGVGGDVGVGGTNPPRLDETIHSVGET